MLKEDIEITPTWAGILPALLELVRVGETAGSRSFAREELFKMARLADRFVLWHKAGRPDPKPIGAALAKFDYILQSNQARVELMCDVYYKGVTGESNPKRRVARVHGHGCWCMLEDGYFYHVAAMASDGMPELTEDPGGIEHPNWAQVDEPQVGEPTWPDFLYCAARALGVEECVILECFA